jgi:alkylhydroperoxidase family enzyme
MRLSRPRIEPLPESEWTDEVRELLPRNVGSIAILRIGWLCRCEYEWGQHVVIGRKAGLSEDEIRRIARGPSAPGWDPFEATLLGAVNELHADSMIGNTTWSALKARYNTQQLLDLVFTVGQYTLVSMALNTLGVQLDAGLAGFPE